jgi:hypothetical protein
VQVVLLTALFYRKMMLLSRGILKNSGFFPFLGRLVLRFLGQGRKTAKKIPEIAKKNGKGIDKSVKM